MLKRLIAIVAVLLSVAGLAVASAAPAAADVHYTCFGYTGIFTDPTVYKTYEEKSWDYGSDNCFGISPGRNIWSTSPGHPWATIPGGGLADGISNLWEWGSASLYSKNIQVWIASTGKFWCQAWWSDTGWNAGWLPC